MNKKSKNKKNNNKNFAYAIKLIWEEAELLDNKDYTKWLSLWSNSGYYIIPIENNNKKFDTKLNYIYDDNSMRKLRIERMTQGLSISANNAAKTIRTISRFIEQSYNHKNKIIVIRSSQIIVAYKNKETTTLATNLIHRIKILKNKPKILDKIIFLINASDTLNPVSFLL